MITLKEIIKSVPLPANRSKKIIKNQSTGDIIKEIGRSDALFSDQGKYIAPFFEGHPEDSINDIYNFMKYQLKYEIEPDSKQTSRAPLRILHDNYNGYGIDCKNYALLSGAILRALNIPYMYRYVSYNNDKKIHHVYTVAKIKNKWYHIDPLQAPPFFKEKKAIFTKNQKPKNMLERLSGIGATSKFQEMALKPVLAFHRNAFIIAVRKNYANVGGRLVLGYEKNPEKIKDWWRSLGGSPSALIKAMGKVPQAAILNTGVKPPPVFIPGTIPPKANPAREAFCRAKYPAKISVNRGACRRGIIRGAIGTPKAALILTAGAAVITSMTKMLAQLGVGSGSTKDYENYIEQPPTDDIMTGLPLPLLIAGGVIAYLFLSSK